MHDVLDDRDLVPDEAEQRATSGYRVGSLPDQCALYGVIHQLEALGLQLLDIRRLPTSDPRTTGPIA